MNKAYWSSIMAAAMLLAFAVIAEAQQPKKVSRMGFLGGISPPVLSAPRRRIPAGFA